MFGDFFYLIKIVLLFQSPLLKYMSTFFLLNKYNNFIFVNKFFFTQS